MMWVEFSNSTNSKKERFIMKRMKLTRLLAFVMMLVMLFALQAPALACSSIELTSKEGDTYWFRTCDMNDVFNVFGENGSYIKSSYLVSYPAGVPIDFVSGTLTPKHTVIGMSFSDSLAVLDGINDAGLTAGLQNFNEGTSYPGDTAPEGYQIVAGMEAATWFLAQCATVEEVKELVKTTYVKAIAVPGIPGSELTATMHLVFTDPTGAQIVLENSDPEHPGVYTVYDSIGVMTNSPTYPEHMANLKDYIGSSPELRSKEIKSITLNGQKIEGTAGSADRLMSAADTSRDRFIRMAIWRYLADEGKNFTNNEMLATGTTVLSKVFVPKDNDKGTYYYQKIEDGKVVGANTGYTQYVVAYDLTNKTVYLQPYDTLGWTKLSLADIDKTQRTTYPIVRGRNVGVVDAAAQGTAPTTPTTPVTPEKPVEKPVAGEKYTVVAGDYLAKIAQDVYGDAGKWSAIYEANRSILKDPNALQPGQILVIPAA